MTKKYFLLLALFCITTHYAKAQKANNKIGIHSITSLGVFNGGKGTSFAVQTIGGIRYQKSFAGVGLGLDYYRYRSIPLFVDLRQEFGKGKEKRNLFVYGDIGYNFDWVEKEKTERTNIYALQNRFSGGVFYDIGAGCNFGFNKYNALVLSAGYSFKKLTSETGSNSCSVIGPCYDILQTYRYYFSRLIFKLGWRF